MVYMGSKSKIAKFIVPIIQQKIEESGSKAYIADRNREDRQKGNNYDCDIASFKIESDLV